MIRKAVAIFVCLLTIVIATDYDPGPTSGKPHVNRNYQWVIALIAIAGFGIISVLAIESYIVWKICSTPQIRQWNTLWLGHVLLFGILCSYVLMFAFLPYPSTTTCGIVRFCVGVCYSMCFAVVFVKLVISLCGELKAPVPTILFAFIWCVQVVIDIQWLIVKRPEVTSIDNSDMTICSPGYPEHVQSLVYVMFLIVACTGMSVLTRWHGRNRMEGGLMGVACGITIAVWVVWILLGFLKHDPAWHDPCMAFGLETTVSVLLVFLFIPKIYQLYHFNPNASFDDDSKSDIGSYADPLSIKPADSVSMMMSASHHKENGSLTGNGSVHHIGNGSAHQTRNGSAFHDIQLYKEKYYVQPRYTQVEPVVKVDETFSKTEVNLNPNALYLQHPLSGRDRKVKKSSSIVSDPGGPSRLTSGRTNPNYASQRTPKINYFTKPSKIQILKLSNGDRPSTKSSLNSDPDLGYGSYVPTVDNRTSAAKPDTRKSTSRV